MCRLYERAIDQSNLTMDRGFWVVQGQHLARHTRIKTSHLMKSIRVEEKKVLILQSPSPKAHKQRFFFGRKMFYAQKYQTCHTSAWLLVHFYRRDIAGLCLPFSIPLPPPPRKNPPSARIGLEPTVICLLGMNATTIEASPGG